MIYKILYRKLKRLSNTNPSKYRGSIPVLAVIQLNDTNIM